MKVHALAMMAIAFIITSLPTPALGEYHPTLGRFMQRDPLGYVDGGNLYAGYFVMLGGVDPMGLELCDDPHEQKRLGDLGRLRAQERELCNAEIAALNARVRSDRGQLGVANKVDPYKREVVTEYDLEDIRAGLQQVRHQIATINDPASKEKDCCGGVPRGHRHNLRCCGNSNNGQWYAPESHCCEPERISTYDPHRPFLTADGISPISWTECRVVAKVSLWVCERPLAGAPWLAGYGGGMPWWLRLTHSYICCDGPNRNCFGKQSGTRAGERIPREPLASGDCQEKKVCPAVKRDKCIFPVAKYDYSLRNRNCHVWAWRGL